MISIQARINEKLNRRRQKRREGRRSPLIKLEQAISDIDGPVDFTRQILGIKLYPKQEELLAAIWQPGVTHVVLSLGRRSGKTTMAAICAVYAAICLGDRYRKALGLRSTFNILCIANKEAQSKVALGMIRDLIQKAPLLKPLIKRQAMETLELTNGAIFTASPASSRGIRGEASPLIIFDELAHSLDTSGNAAGDQLYQAVAPGAAQFGKYAKILMLSTPWIQGGIFWDFYNQGQSPDYPSTFSISLPTWEVNPHLPYDGEFLKEERDRDPWSFNIEYGANFASPVGAFLSSDDVEACILREHANPTPTKSDHYYTLSLDPAKGGRDEYVACILHWEKDECIVDRWYVFEPSVQDGKRKLVSVEEVENWIIESDRRYRFHKIILDQYNSQSTIQSLKKRGLPCRELHWSAKSVTEAYTKLRNLVISGNLNLYRHKKAIEQLKGLIVRYNSVGTMSISGGDGAGVDDYCAALAGAVLVSTPPRPPGRSGTFSMSMWG